MGIDRMPDIERRERIDRAYREAEVTLTREFGPPDDEEAHARIADEILTDLADDYQGAVATVERARLLAEWMIRDRGEPDKLLAYLLELHQITTGGGQCA